MNSAQIPIRPPLWLILIVMTAVACTPKAESSKRSKGPQKKEAKQESPKSEAQDLHEYFPEFRASSKGLELRFLSKIARKNGEQSFKTIIKLASVVKLDGQDYVEYVIKNEGLAGSSPKTVYYRTGEDGIWKKDRRDAKAALEIPFPMQINQSWSFNTETVKNYGVATALEGIEVGGKRYENCLRIEYQLTTIKGRLASRATQVEHRARGLGMVKSVIEYQSGETFSLNLESATIPRKD